MMFLKQTLAIEIEGLYARTSNFQGATNRSIVPSLTHYCFYWSCLNVLPRKNQTGISKFPAQKYDLYGERLK